jgi:type IV secretory pathway TraG/TraD family ATPase VirD4
MAIQWQYQCGTRVSTNCRWLRSDMIGRAPRVRCGGRAAEWNGVHSWLDGVCAIRPKNCTLTAGWRSKFSHRLLFDPTNSLAARFNPLFEVRKGTREMRDVQNIADILVDPQSAGERRDHWEKTAHALLTGAVLHVPDAEKDKTLACVAAILADPSRSIVRTLKIMLTTNHFRSQAEPQGATAIDLPEGAKVPALTDRVQIARA